MNFFKFIFPAPTKDKTLEDLAYYRAKLKVAIAHEKLIRYVDGDLINKIGELSGMVAKLEARLKSFDEK